MIAGPPSEIKPLLEFMIKFMQEYTSDFGAEQYALNVFAYHFKNQIQNVGYAWNCLPHFGVLECASESSGDLHHYSAFRPVYRLRFGKRLSVKLAPFNGDREIEIAILHMHKE